MLQAVLWDVDGTLAETERDGHRIAFNEAFAALAVPWRWSETRYGELLAIAGGRERLLFDMRFQEHAPAGLEAREQLAARLHRRKNELYAAIVASGALPLRPGVRELIRDCTAASVRMAIVTTTSRANVDALLRTHLGEGWPEQFAAVVCAEEAPKKKPDPQVYHLALEALEVENRTAVAIEDAPAGIAAAQAAGVPVIVNRSYYFPCPVAAGVLACGPSLAERCDWVPEWDAGESRLTLGQIRRWHTALRRTT